MRNIADQSRIEQFHNAIAYHKMTPNKQDVAQSFQTLRDAAREFGDIILETTEPSREQSLALTHVEEALMWATKQVAITQLPVAERI